MFSLALFRVCIFFWMAPFGSWAFSCSSRMSSCSWGTTTEPLLHAGHETWVDALLILLFAGTYVERLLPAVARSAVYLLHIKGCLRCV